MCEAFPRAAPEIDFRLEAAASIMVLGKLAPAVEHLERAHSLAKQLADPFAEQRSISLWGYVELARGELQRAREAFERATELAQSNADTQGAYFGEHYLSHVQFQLDNLMSYEIVATGVREGRVSIHGWLYDMTQGEIQAYDGTSGTWRGLLEVP